MIATHAKQRLADLLGRENFMRISRTKNKLEYFLKEGRRKSSNTLELTELSVKNRHTFFGYYDKTPFSQDNSKVLAIVAPLINRTPRSTDKILVGYFDLTQGNIFCPVGETETWCWQQGCRLQWFPGNENELIIYNKIVDGQYGSVIQNIRTKTIVAEYRSPIYDVDISGQWVLSLNFSRLHRLRPGYGYVNIADHTVEQRKPDDDGLWMVNLMKNEEPRLQISLNDLARIKPLPTMSNAEHYINHLSFNPSGNRLLLYHLWINESQRYSRVLTCETEGDNICVLANAGHASHYTWKTDEEVLIYSSHQESGTHYYTYRDKSAWREVVGESLLIQDGHPSYSPDKNMILTDTYPDRFGDRKLFLYSIIDDKLSVLGSFYSPVHLNGEWRCDLHPRWDRQGKTICFDSAHNNHRALYLIKAC